MQIDYLANHTSLIAELASLRFREFNYMTPGKTLEDYVRGLHEHCNFNCFPIAYVALENDTFAGTFSLRVCDLQSHKHFTPWLAGVLVPPEKRKQGIGAVIVKEAEDAARKMGYDVLYLFTPNKAAWYLKLGWNVVEGSILNNVPITVMLKFLKV